MKYLVTGATGSIGAALVRVLSDEGESVRAFVRSRSKTQMVFGQAEPEIFTGDIFDDKALISAADGVDVIFHCANFPLDRFELHRMAISNVVCAAASAGASVIWPGNVWVYGPAQYNPVDLKHPLEPTSELGRQKLAADSQVRPDTVHALCLLAGEPQEQVVKAAYDHPEHFLMAVDALEKEANLVQKIRQLGGRAHNWLTSPGI